MIITVLLVWYTGDTYIYLYFDRDDAVKALEGVKEINGHKVQVSFATKRQAKKTKRRKADVDDDDEECGTSTKKLKLDAEDISTSVTSPVPQEYGNLMLVVTSI